MPQTVVAGLAGWEVYVSINSTIIVWVRFLFLSAEYSSVKDWILLVTLFKSLSVSIDLRYDLVILPYNELRYTLWLQYE